MIVYKVYKCDRCKKEIDFSLPAFTGKEYLRLEVDHNCCGFKTTEYLLCEKCKQSFEDFMDGLEVVAL